MDQLQAIIKTFSVDEKRDFRQFIQRKKLKGQRKDLTLFDLMYTNTKLEKSQILHELYHNDSAKTKNAYHTIRKRLLIEINDFLYLKRVDADASMAGEINKSLSLVQHLIEHQLLKLAWKHLLKAEQLAVSSELNKQLVWIYDLQIEHYHAQWADKSIQDIVVLRMKANALFQEDESLKIIGSLVKQELERIKLTGEDVELQLITDDLIKQFELEGALFKRPRLLYNFVFLTRTIILGRKDYASFEGFVLNSYGKLVRSDYFSNNLGEHLQILYVIAQTLYRTKKFDKAIEFLDLMHIQLESANKGLYKQYYPKYLLLYSASENFRGNAEFAIELLEQTVAISYLENVDRLNGILNLAVYNFELEAYKSANCLLIDIGHTDQWMEKIMGREWRLKKLMIEAIFQFELGNADLAFDRLVSIERNFTRLLSTKKYAKVLVFIRIIKKYIDDPSLAKSSDFISEIEGSFVWLGAEQEDIQEMSYYAWLKSKILGEKFYPTLLKLIQDSN